MSKARLVITAVVLEGRRQADVARDYKVSPGWVSKLVARYRLEGDTAFEPRSRRPKQSPNALPSETITLIITIRASLVGQGLDAGAETISWHLKHEHQIVTSPATIWRHLHAAGLITPEPKKRPRSSYIRFEAEQPNETWQSDFTHYRLVNGQDSEIISWLDDHSRYALSINAYRRITGPIVVNTFQDTHTTYGKPLSTLTDNGMVYTTRFSGGRNGFETELHRLGIKQKNSRPSHPTTCGKVERFQQTLKQWLAQQPQPATIPELQALCDTFREIYNTRRPHRSLPHRATPDTIYTTRPPATPPQPSQNPETHHRVRRDRVDDAGSVTLRVHGRLHHIGIGRTHARTPILMLIDDLHVVIINATTGEKLREVTIDTSRDYQPTGKPKGPTKTTTNIPK